MKKILPTLVAVLVIVILGVVGWMIFKPEGKETSQGEQQSQNFQIVDACEVFTLEEAQTILGSTTTKGESGETASSSDDVTVSSCTYTYDPGTVSGIKTASVLARSPKSETGAESNLAQFDPVPEGAQEVTGIGEMAFWNPALGQLNVLKSNVWLIISSGGPKPDEHTQADAEAVANVVVPDVN